MKHHVTMGEKWPSFKRWSLGERHSDDFRIDPHFNKTLEAYIAWNTLLHGSEPIYITAHEDDTYSVEIPHSKEAAHYLSRALAHSTITSHPKTQHSLVAIYNFIQALLGGIPNMPHEGLIEKKMLGIALPVMAPSTPDPTKKAAATISYLPAFSIQAQITSELIDFLEKNGHTPDNLLCIANFLPADGRIFLSERYLEAVKYCPGKKLKKEAVSQYAANIVTAEFPIPKIRSDEARPDSYVIDITPVGRLSPPSAVGAGTGAGSGVATASLGM